MSDPYREAVDAMYLAADEAGLNLLRADCELLAEAAAPVMPGIHAEHDRHVRTIERERIEQQLKREAQRLAGMELGVAAEVLRSMAAALEDQS